MKRSPVLFFSSCYFLVEYFFATPMLIIAGIEQFILYRVYTYRFPSCAKSDPVGML